MDHYNFVSLLGEYNIEIPIIQRDYAQGRLDTKSEEIRKKFVSDLLEVIFSDEKTINLDFIYGTEKQNILTLLDGQQRVTTLFLIHWYLANRLGCLNLVKDKLARFSYKTRVTARDFCRALVQQPIELIHVKEGKTVSEFIEDSSWFHSVWKNDPTVQSMLIVLDEIQGQLASITLNESAIKKLFDVERSPITFHFLHLENFGLTDELYIKMNARGVPLSDFENFKAWLISITDKNDQITLPLDFWLKLDKDWVDIFWEFSTTVTSPHFRKYEIDEPFLQYFKTMILFEVLEKIELESIKDRFQVDKLIAGLQGQSHISFKIYEDNGYLTTSFFEKIARFLEFVRLDNLDTSKHILFDSIFEGGMLNLVALYSRLVFIVNKKNVIEFEQEFSRWVRISNNLIKNTALDSSLDLAKAIQSLASLVDYQDSVIEHFSNLESKDIAFFNIHQRHDEILKAQLVKRDIEWENIFIQAEQHEYFYGQIKFIIDLSEHDNSDGYSKDKFQSYVSKLSVLFSRKILASESHLIHRSLLTQADYSIPASRNRYLCKSSTGDARDRNENWRKLFTSPARLLSLMALVDSVSETNIEGSLTELIDKSQTNDWRMYFIRYPELFVFCKEKLIRFENSLHILVLSKTKIFGAHVELRTYCLYLELSRQVRKGKRYDFEFHYEPSCSESIEPTLNILDSSGDDYRVTHKADFALMPKLVGQSYEIRPLTNLPIDVIEVIKAFKKMDGRDE